MNKIGFVSPWYGENISGGAEAELRELVHHLADAGVELEILTTCVRSFRDDWNINAHNPGLSMENGIPVRRFLIRKRDVRQFDEVNAKLIRGEMITAAEEEIYCREMINSPALYDFIREHSADYAVFVFIPYMFGTTYYGCQIVPEKSILIPCLHDESYAYLKCFREAFSGVRGMIFHAEPEKNLAEKLYGIQGDHFPVLGEGINTEWTADGLLFREKTGIRSPFILYAGRKEAGKRVDMLLRYFAHYRKTRQTDLKLVLIGGGKIDNPDPENILDLGFVDRELKYGAYAAAEFFCNPSEMESFSIVVMESWLAERPVLVNGACAVTRDFVHKANAGLYFENMMEFFACVDYLIEHKQTAHQMGKNGRRYVLEHFNWTVIVRQYREYFQKVCEEQ